MLRNDPSAEEIIADNCLPAGFSVCGSQRFRILWTTEYLFLFHVTVTSGREELAALIRSYSACTASRSAKLRVILREE